VRALEYFVATSVDGFIAREDGDFSPLLVEGDSLQALVEEYPETLPAQAREALGVDAVNRRFDTVVMGAGTYRVPGGRPSPYPQLRQYVASRSLPEVPAEVTVLSGDLLSEVRRLKEEDGLSIWLCGGSALAGALLPEIDRLFLKVSPVVLGRGLPLFGTGSSAVRFTPTGVRTFANGVLFLEFDRMGPGVGSSQDVSRRSGSPPG
jgi:dihydrofolate reductase